MKPLRQEKIYLRLYRTWQLEHKQKKIATIPNKDCFIDDLQDLIQFLKKLEAEAKKTLIKMVHRKTIQNIR